MARALPPRKKPNSELRTREYLTSDEVGRLQQTARKTWAT